jgi:hypothetical protein
MAAVSQFSTPENFAKATQAIAQLQAAINEAQIAVQAGIPGAQQALQVAQDALARVQLFKQTYFPSGAP